MSVSSPVEAKQPALSESSVERLLHPGGLPAAPMVLGVAGHRHLNAADCDVLRQKLGELFRQFQQAYPQSPLVLLSSLAEGADQLAAEVALEHGVLVRAPLPFAAEIFRQSTSFSSEEARLMLDKLLADPRVEAFVAPMPAGTLPPGTDWLTVATDKNDPRLRDIRRACYANAGGYVVRHSLAFIALWDGEAGDPARPSGTAEYVVFKLQGRAPAYYPWADAEPLGFRGDRGPVYAINTPRANPKPAEPKAAVTAQILVPTKDKPFEAMPPTRKLARRIRPWTRVLHSLLGLPGWLYRHFGGKPSSMAEAKAELWQFQETCQAVDDFNRDVRQAWDPDGLRRRLERVPAELPPDVAPASSCGHWLLRLSAVRTAAAHLANKLKPWVDRFQACIFWLFAFSALAFHFYAHWPKDTLRLEFRPVALWCFFGSLGAAVVLIGIIRWRRSNERRLDYRALAEALRVRRAWAVAGIGASVADSYLGQLRSEMTWIRRTLTHVCPPASAWADDYAVLSDAQKLRRLDAVKTDWVKDQVEQFRKSHQREEGRASFFGCIGFSLALLGWALIPLIYAILHWGLGSAVDLADPHEPWLIASGMLVVGGGLCIAFRERRSHEELANQYERLRVTFESGLTELERRLGAGDLAGAQAVVEALGHEAIAEHAQWLILRRARPLELHIG